MDYLLIRSRGALAIQGVIALVLGIFALLLPGPTFFALTIAFGIYALVDGISALIALFDRRTTLSRGWLVIEALAGILVGIFALTRPSVAALYLALLIGAWAIVTGVSKIIAAVALRKQISREWLLALSGVVTILFGGILLLTPVTGIAALMLIVGAFGVIIGFTLLALSFRIRRLETLAEEPPIRRAA